MIHFDGFDVTKEWMSLSGIADEFARRGVSTLMVDHPGIGAALRLQGLAMNPDSERWAKAAMDWLETRSDVVDAKKVGVVAMSLGGYYAPRAAAFEPRLACCVAWGARWDNAGSHGRMLRDASAARSVTGWLDHALWYYGAADVDEAEREDRADDARRRDRAHHLSAAGRARRERPAGADRAGRAHRRRAQQQPAARIARASMSTKAASSTSAATCSRSQSTRWPTGSPTPAAAGAHDAAQSVDYVAPDDARRRLPRARGARRGCLAGGQSLVAAMNLGLATPGRLVSLREIAALRGVRRGPTAGCASARW